jgi:antitoxin HicB
MATKTSKTLEEYLELNYPFRVDADPDGGYVITFPDLPGCMTQVEDVGEIGAAAEEVRRLWIMTEYEDAAEIPLPSYPEEYSGKFNLRLPKSLHRRLAELAEREAVSLNQLAVSLLAAGDAVSRAGIQEQKADLSAPGDRLRLHAGLAARTRKARANTTVRRSKVTPEL